VSFLRYPWTWCSSLMPCFHRCGLGMITDHMWAPRLCCGFQPCTWWVPDRSSVLGYVNGTESHQSGFVLPARSICARISAALGPAGAGAGGGGSGFGVGAGGFGGGGATGFSTTGSLPSITSDLTIFRGKLVVALAPLE